jgi:hypothetical protein
MTPCWPRGPRAAPLFVTYEILTGALMVFTSVVPA